MKKKKFAKNKSDDDSNLILNELVLKSYKNMIKSRLFEEAVIKIWDDGLISGEMHMGIGEEAIISGILSQIKEGDAIATDHRGTPPFVMRGIELEPLLLEFMGHPDGICKGYGGHMHLFSKKNLISSSGIVGAAGPAAAGYALALKKQKEYKKNLAIGFFGEGAMNQGHLLESFNLAAGLELPILFVCKDNGWAITTQSEEITGGSLVERARGFGIEAIEINGLDLFEVLNTAENAMEYIRTRKRPYFILAKCVHREGHFLGDPLLRFHEDAKKEFGEVTPDLMKAFMSRKGASVFKRTASMGKVLGLIRKSGTQLKKDRDPIFLFENRFKINSEQSDKLLKIKNSIRSEVNIAVTSAISKYNREFGTKYEFKGGSSAETDKTEGMEDNTRIKEAKSANKTGGMEE